MCKDADRLFSNWHEVKFHSGSQSLTIWDIGIEGMGLAFKRPAFAFDTTHEIYFIYLGN